MGVGDVIGIIFGLIALLGGLMNLQNNLTAAIICFYCCSVFFVLWR